MAARTHFFNYIRQVNGVKPAYLCLATVMQLQNQQSCRLPTMWLTRRYQLQF